ncbi:MAG: ribbon-helix-helix protein, CopG family [Thermoplasmatota archaeon]
MATKSAELKLRLEPELLAEVEGLAAEMGRSKSEVVRAGIQALKEQRERDVALGDLIAVAKRDSKRLRGRKPPKERYALK